MKINYLEMSDLGDMMEDFKKSHNFESSIKQHTFFGFWGKVVGKKFVNNSKCVKISSEGILTVACKNSFVSNELLLFKEEVLRKANVYANPLNITINDIVFSHKIWKEQPKPNEEEEPQEIRRERIPDEVLEGVVLNPEEIETVKSAVNDISFASDEEKDKMFNAIIKNLKEQKIRSQKNV